MLAFWQQQSNCLQRCDVNLEIGSTTFDVWLARCAVSFVFCFAPGVFIRQMFPKRLWLQLLLFAIPIIVVQAADKCM